jgi:hypothetical protein
MQIISQDHLQINLIKTAITIIQIIILLIISQQKFLNRIFKDNKNFKNLLNIPSIIHQLINLRIAFFLAMPQYITDIECLYQLISLQFLFKWIQSKDLLIKFQDVAHAEHI